MKKGGSRERLLHTKNQNLTKLRQTFDHVLRAINVSARFSFQDTSRMYLLLDPKRLRPLILKISE